MSNGIVYVMCTNVGRAILKSHLTYHPEINILKIYCLDEEKGASKSNYDSYIDLKIKYNLPIEYIKSINSPEVLSYLRKVSPTLIIQSGWSQKFCDELLEIPTYGCIGEHPSPIPKGRGAACVNWALINGEREWGDSFFRMTDEYDAGVVISQKKIEMLNNDTVFTFYNKIAWSSYCTIKEKLQSWNKGDLTPSDVTGNEPSYFYRRTPEDGEIDESMTAIQQYNYVRALTKPYPGAFFKLKGKKIIVWESSISSQSVKYEKFKVISNHVLILNERIYLKGSCGNYLLPEFLESDEVPYLDIKTFCLNFLKE